LWGPLFFGAVFLLLIDGLRFRVPVCFSRGLGFSYFSFLGNLLFLTDILAPLFLGELFFPKVSLSK